MRPAPETQVLAKYDCSYLYAGSKTTTKYVIYPIEQITHGKGVLMLQISIFTNNLDFSFKHFFPIYPSDLDGLYSSNILRICMYMQRKPLKRPSSSA